MTRARHDAVAVRCDAQRETRCKTSLQAAKQPHIELGQNLCRMLQEAALWRAGALDCYQVRSWSSADHVANHRLKRAMGFAALPERRSNDEQGVYYLWPLRSASWLPAAE